MAIEATARPRCSDGDDGVDNNGDDAAKTQRWRERRWHGDDAAMATEAIARPLNRAVNPNETSERFCTRKAGRLCVLVCVIHHVHKDTGHAKQLKPT